MWTHPRDRSMPLILLFAVTVSAQHPPPESPKPPPHKDESKDLFLLLLLLLLLVPLAVGVFFLVRCCRKARYLRLARRVRLWGRRQPGSVDDAEMGKAIGGGEWLEERVKPYALGPVRGAPNVTGTVEGGPVPSAEFDPILDEAEAHRRRWHRRRRLTDLDAAPSSASSARSGEANAEANEDDGEETNAAKATYDAATARVWLRGLGDAPNAAEASMETKTARTVGHHRRVESQAFEDILATVAPTAPLGAEFREKSRVLTSSPTTAAVAVDSAVFGDEKERKSHTRDEDDEEAEEEEDEEEEEEEADEEEDGVKEKK